MAVDPKSVEQPLNRDEIAAIARAAGLQLSPEHFEDLVQAYGHLHPMLQRLPRGDFDGVALAPVLAPRKSAPKD